MADEPGEGLEIVLRHPNGRVEQIVVDASSVLIGSGAHCDVRLPPEHAAVEHVTLSLVGGAVHAHARSLDPYPTINGAGFLRTPVLPDAVLGVGPVQIRATVIHVADQKLVIHKRAEGMSPLTYVLVAIGLPIGIYLVVAGGPPDLTQSPPGSPPPLWEAPITTCPQNGRDAAFAIGIDKLNIALAKRERRPFHVEDGVAAVPLFETAAACFGVARQLEAAADAARSAQELRSKVNDDYRAHQVRLEHALTVKDWAGAQKEVKVLRALTDGRQAGYVEWLSNLARRLTLQLGHKEKTS
jgi:hypothetical protein